MRLVLAALALGLGGLFLTFNNRQGGSVSNPTPTTDPTPTPGEPEAGVIQDYNWNAPRGIRNNNPGNIRHGDSWQGMASEQPDSEFVYFVDPRYGIRAMVRIFHSYAGRGVNTLGEIIQTWAPPIENNTGAYVNAVASRLGVNPSTVIDLDNRELVVDLLEAITLHENGQQPYNRNTFIEGYNLA